MIIRWMVTIEPGARNPRFNARMVFKTFAQIGEYWVIQPEQVTSRPNVIFQLTNRNLGVNVAAATSGIRIFIGNYPFVSDAQLTAVLTHEIGHVITPGNKHANDPRNVMYAKLNDVFKNFYTEDPNWFRLQWKSTRRPWQEPNRWRPKTTSVVEDFQPCEVGHIEPSWYETIRNILIPRKQMWVYE